MLSGGVLVAMAAFPGLPTMPFLLLGGGVGYAGWRSAPKTRHRRNELGSDGFAAPAKENLEALLKVEPLAVEVGLGLVQAGRRRAELAAAAPDRGDPAADGRAISAIMVPPVRVTDNLQLKASEYAVLLKGAEIGRFELMQNCELAIHPGGAAAAALEGVPTREPAFGIQALWIPIRDRGPRAL